MSRHISPQQERLAVDSVRGIARKIDSPIQCTRGLRGCRHRPASELLEEGARSRRSATRRHRRMHVLGGPRAYSRPRNRAQIVPTFGKKLTLLIPVTENRDWKHVTYRNLEAARTIRLTGSPGNFAFVLRYLRHDTIATGFDCALCSAS